MTYDDEGRKTQRIKPRKGNPCRGGKETYTPKRSCKSAQNHQKRIYPSLYSKGKKPLNDFDSINALDQRGELDNQRGKKER